MLDRFKDYLYIQYFYGLRSMKKLLRVCMTKWRMFKGVDNMKNVVCFGDSLTDINVFGYSWTTTVQSMIPYLNFINSARGGGLTSDFMESDLVHVDKNKLDTFVMSHNPSCVMITLGGNDIVTLADSPEAIFKRYQAIVNYFRSYGVEVVMGGYDITQEQCDRVWDEEHIYIHDKKTLKLRFSQYTRMIKNWHTEITNDSFSKPGPTVSLYEGVTNLEGKIPTQYLRDAVHLTQDGAQKVGEYVATSLNSYFYALSNK